MEIKEVGPGKDQTRTFESPEEADNDPVSVQAMVKACEALAWALVMKKSYVLIVAHPEAPRGAVVFGVLDNKDDLPKLAERWEAFRNGMEKA